MPHARVRDRRSHRPYEHPLSTDLAPMPTTEFGGTQPLNYEQRRPVVLLVDTSPSMSEPAGESTAIAEVNRGLQHFARQVHDNPITAARLDLALVSFDSDATVQRPFALIGDAPLPDLHCDGGCTNLVAGVERSLQLLRERKAWYDEVGLPRYRGYLLVITDGAPTNSAEELAALRARLHDAVTRKHLHTWAFATTGAPLDALRDLVGKECVQAFATQDFGAFFQWLSASFEKITASREGEVVRLDDPGIFRHSV